MNSQSLLGANLYERDVPFLEVNNKIEAGTHRMTHLQFQNSGQEYSGGNSL